MSQAELYLARDMGAATYLSSFIWILAGELKIPKDDITNESVNAMAELMVEPINHATMAAFCMMMNDVKGCRDELEKLRQALNGLQSI